MTAVVARSRYRSSVNLAPQAAVKFPAVPTWCMCSEKWLQQKDKTPLAIVPTI